MILDTTYARIFFIFLLLIPIVPPIVIDVIMKVIITLECLEVCVRMTKRAVYCQIIMIRFNSSIISGNFNNFFRKWIQLLT